MCHKFSKRKLCNTMGEKYVTIDRGAIVLLLTIVIFITNLWTYLLHKFIRNKVTNIPKCYNEKNVKYIPNLVNIMY